MDRHVPNSGDRPQHSIHIGGVFASRTPAIVRTLLGSCIAVCLRDVSTGVGGMNHFMLPVGSDSGAASARYGVHAMELLINQCMTNGAKRSMLEAKVFGGGHVLRIRETDGNVPQSNIKFAMEFLHTENIPVAAKDVGGYDARDILFFTDTGRTLLRRLSRTDQSSRAHLAEIERVERKAIVPPKPQCDDGDITLF